MMINKLLQCNPSGKLLFKGNDNKSGEETKLGATTQKGKHELNGLRGLSNYNVFIVTRPKKRTESSTPIDVEKLEALGIPNFSLLPNNGVRGESLSSRKNRRYIPAVRESGIKDVIDLRNDYASVIFPELCEENGLAYHKIPIDSFSVEDKKIIANMPELFYLLDKGNFYIACAQGLHRTDIALSLNYVFNPNEDSETPPVLKGHSRDYGLKFDDIARRLASIKRSLTEEDIKTLGWDESFEEEYHHRKDRLKSYNKELLSAN